MGLLLQQYLIDTPNKVVIMSNILKALFLLLFIFVYILLQNIGLNVFMFLTEFALGVDFSEGVNIVIRLIMLMSMNLCIIFMGPFDSLMSWMYPNSIWARYNRR